MMSRTINLKKGLDIPLKGSAELTMAGTVEAELYAVKPVDFPGLIPKLNVKPGDLVKAGDVLFHDKTDPSILFTSPVSGIVRSVERGERRKMLEVCVEAKGSDFIDFGKADPLSLSRAELTAKLLVSGLWPAIRQRPYQVVAKPGDTPKSVFISCFDTAPLAPDYNFILQHSSSAHFRAGIKVLGRLTDGKVNLVLNGRKEKSVFFDGLEGVEFHQVSGPHPAGNPGVQIHHIDPVNKGETVWFVNMQDVSAIGRLFTDGVYRPERIIALTGSEVTQAAYFRMLSGASVARLVNGRVKDGKLRYISGNVLTGRQISADGFLGYYDSQVTVIPEGSYHEFFGWAIPGINKFSFSGTFLSALFRNRKFSLDTNYHGGERAFVVTGQYEKVVPMDIYPMQLLKAILAQDIDQMENLGIYEVAEEDFALCEFICPSKIEIQSIVRKGLDLMRKEMN